MSGTGCIAALTPLAAGAAVSSEAVLFESRGVVLVLGDDASAGDVAQALVTHHRTVVFAPGVDAREFDARVTAVGRRVTAVRGYLGAFQAEVTSAAGVSDIGAASPNPGRFFDMVLDLRREPQWASGVAPLGYYAPGEDAAKRSAAVASMRGLVGRFTKPRYFGYRPELCAHGASGLHGCTRCLDVCATQAISSAGALVRVNPHLCQGCASCTLACPTGALSFKYPSREALGERLRQALSGVDPVNATLIVHSGALSSECNQAVDRHGAKCLQVNPIPAFGDELWVRAFGLGVKRLVLVNDAAASKQSRMAVAARVAQMHAILPALGIARANLVWLTQGELTDWLETRPGSGKPAVPGEQQDVKADAAIPAAVSPRSAEDLSGGRSKRLVWLDALRQSAAGTGAGTAVELAGGAPFGEVRVYRRRCTLCFACTQLCPTGALLAQDGKTQRLLFRESACVQCGLCAQGCPEKAVSLHARFAAPAMLGMGTTVLHQDEQQACQSCGTPFISRRLLASSLERLKAHPVMASGGREALLTCPACRQRAMLSLS